MHVCYLYVRVHVCTKLINIAPFKYLTKVYSSTRLTTIYIHAICQLYIY